jgi:hypothetical protein
MGIFSQGSGVGNPFDFLRSAFKPPGSPAGGTPAGVTPGAGADPQANVQAFLQQGQPRRPDPGDQWKGSGGYGGTNMIADMINALRSGHADYKQRMASQAPGAPLSLAPPNPTPMTQGPAAAAPTINPDTASGAAPPSPPPMSPIGETQNFPGGTASTPWNQSGNLGPMY